MTFHWKHYRLMVELLKDWEGGGKKHPQGIMLKQITAQDIMGLCVCVCVFFTLLQPIAVFTSADITSRKPKAR